MFFNGRLKERLAFAFLKLFSLIPKAFKNLRKIHACDHLNWSTSSNKISQIKA
jgi:hypothetical protein